MFSGKKRLPKFTVSKSGGRVWEVFPDEYTRYVITVRFVPFFRLKLRLVDARKKIFEIT